MRDTWPKGHHITQRDTSTKVSSNIALVTAMAEQIRKKNGAMAFV